MMVAVVAIEIRVPPSWWISSSGRTILSHGYRGSAQKQGRVRPIRADLVIVFSSRLAPAKEQFTGVGRSKGCDSAQTRRANNVAKILCPRAGHDVWTSWRRVRCRPTHICNSTSYPWCAQGDSIVHCYYMTREQCEAAVNYHGFCIANSSVPSPNNEAPQPRLQRRR